MNRPSQIPYGLVGRSVFTSRIVFLAASCCVIAAMATHAHAVESLRRSAIVRAVEQARPSVVNITGQKLVPSGDQYSDSKKRVNGMGTGVVVDSRGYVLTNYHVIEGVRRINVTTTDGKSYIARPIAHDPGTDLAIIKIPTRTPMKVVKVGSSRDILWGETVIAMGNAYGYENTVTTGIVSALHRNVQVNDTQSYRDLIQTDASINPGNSGGPLLNIDGDMIGINVAVRVGAQGIGFAIPIDQGLQVAARLMSIERVTGLWHGVIYEDQNQGSDTSVVVRKVQPNSPAAKAGIRPGDVIRQVGNRKVDHGFELECALIGTEAGEKVSFAVERGTQPVDLQIGLENKPANLNQSTLKTSLKTAVVDSPAWSKMGMNVTPVDSDHIQGMDGKFRGGLQVVAVKRGGLADQEGIQKDDILVGIHVWETISQDNLLYIMNDADFKESTRVPFYVVRKGKTLEGEFDVESLR